MRKKKVLYVFGGEFASGGEYVIERLMINNQDVEPTLFIAPGAYSNSLKQKYSFEIVELNALKKLNRSRVNIFLFCMRAIFNYLIVSKKVLSYSFSNEISIVHANTLGPASYLLPAILLSKLFRFKIFWLWSDHDLIHHSALDKFLLKLCSKFYNLTLVVSYAVKSKYSPSNDKVKVLYNGLDTRNFKRDDIARERLRDLYSLEKDCLVIGIAGFIAPRKGQIQLIEAIQSLNLSSLRLKLLITGLPLDANSSYYNEFLAKVNQNSNTIYVGSSEDMVAFYNCCDVVVNNSSINGSEPLGTTIYEGMACERIVVAASVGGTPEIISDGIDGFLYHAENMTIFLSIVNTILDRNSDFNIIKNNARRKVIEKFDVNVMSKSYNIILNQLIQKQ
ncbi:glycosyltransferase [Pedobacter frigidisoli]|uniref:Glycosyltransferase n=1 Tax=Pedobacter frigidisoli TaxID=2530455 RepID=A0A4R0NM82_9SPHI|nr:glycosyltransferase family 4 protein [Pedobacter frigidisoli]TCD01962.1 glycosyltransferase [Pedobacter frigidisoli]